MTMPRRRLRVRAPCALAFALLLFQSHAAYAQDKVALDEEPEAGKAQLADTAKEPQDDAESTKAAIDPEAEEPSAPLPSTPSGSASSNTSESSPSEEESSRAAHKEDKDPDTKSPKPTSSSEKETKPEQKPKEVSQPPPPVDYARLPWTYHQRRLDLGAAVVFGWVQDPAFDLFQTRNNYASWQAHTALTVWTKERLSLAASARFQRASVEGTVRDTPSFLGVSHLLVGAETRYHFLPRLYSYARLDLGAFLARSHIGEVDEPGLLEQEGAGFSGGLSVGGAARVAGSPDGRTRAPRLHLFAETGLFYSAPLSLNYEMSTEGALRPAPVDLGTLSLGGPRIVAGAMVSY